MYPFFRRSDMKIFNIPRPIALRDSYVPLRNPFRNCCWRFGPYWRPALSVPVQSKRLLSRPPIRHCLFFLLSFCLFVLLSFCLVAFFVFLSRCIFVFLDFYIKEILFILLFDFPPVSLLNLKNLVTSPHIIHIIQNLYF